jgi:hypothetical protein
VLLAAAPLAGAQETQRFDACDTGTSQRIRFIEDHLDGKRRYANRWWMTWNGVYVGGILYGGGRAAMEGDAGERADYVVSAVKSGIGLGQNLWDPPPAREGADALHDMPADSPAACAERLARGEELLRRNAEDSRKERFGWLPHAGNVALNAAGGLIVAQGFDEPSGWVSAALGVVVGEVRIWTYPWQAGGALAEYERRFPASGVPQSPPTSLNLEPWGNGARLVLRY